MNILIACEYSGVVRRACAAKGHVVVSCDLLESDDASPMHIKGDVRELLYLNCWDLMIAHPPCTHLACSGARWFSDKRADGRQQAAIDFALLLWTAPIPRIVLENPVSILSTHIRKPDQVIHPWQHGDSAEKATCLWLKNLSLIVPSNVVNKGTRNVYASGKSMPSWYDLPPSADRAKVRSRTFQGIANAFANTWC